ncbi:MAG: glycosyltransferase [Blastocatellia bacterium]
MIFVTVGNATQQFPRLLKAVDDLSASGFFETETVIVQTGNNTDIRLAHCQQQAFLAMEEFEQHMHNAGLIICHGGCGTLLHAARSGKTPVVMPRRKIYGEHVNDHQLQLVNELASQGRVVPAYEPADLTGAILEAKRRNTHSAPSHPSPMIELVAQAITELLRQ